jgi:hypothetical protein
VTQSMVTVPAAYPVSSVWMRSSLIAGPFRGVVVVRVLLRFGSLPCGMARMRLGRCPGRSVRHLQRLA